MVEERNAALDGGGHAHLVLLHEQLMQVSFDVRVQELRDERLAGNARQGRMVSGVGIDAAEPRAQFRSQELVLGGAPEHRKIVEIQLIKIRPTHEEGACSPLSQPRGYRQSLEGTAQSATRELRQVAPI